MSVPRPRLVSGRRSAVAAVAMLTLTACAGTAPGVAADVEGAEITDQQVDDFAQALCAIGGVQGTPSGTPSRSARTAALQILISNELAAQVADVDAVPEQQVAPVLEQLLATRDSVPDDLQESFERVARDYAEAQNALLILGRESLRDAGEQEVDDQQAYDEGTRLLAEYASEADVEVDPRFGELAEGRLLPGGGSLSVPVSDLAVQGAQEQPGDGFVGTLPASQKCD